MVKHKIQKTKWVTRLSFVLIFLWGVTSQAQTYSSGSTGFDGAFAPTSSMSLTLPANGVFNFTTVNIPIGVAVTFIPNAANTPVTILATGDVTIAGTISVNGTNGLPVSSTGTVVNPGSAGGPGGFLGGLGGARGNSNNTPGDGQGPGGGACCYSTSNSYYSATFGNSGAYGAAASFTSLVPLFGGSGGSGGNGNASYAGASGGGGGGAMVISSSTKIFLTGLITANGGIGGNNTLWYTNYCQAYVGCNTVYDKEGGSGSGGAIRLIAPQITGAGSIQAMGGSLYNNYDTTGVLNGKPGIIRLEAFNLSFSGASNPSFYTSISPGPVTSASNPSLVSLPALTFRSIGTVSSPAVPGGSYTTADVSLPQGTVNPVSVTLSAVNIPVGTVFTVRLIPQFASSTSYNTSPSTGTFSSSTASVPLNFPTGQISVLNAYASFTVPTQVAMLYPLIDGEPVERVMVAANYGQASEVTFFTKSGKEMKADRLFKDLR